MQRAVKTLDAAVLSRAELQHGSFGTTAVFALALGNALLIGHVGDSKAMLCQKNASTMSGFDAYGPSDSEQQAEHAPAHAAALDRLTAVPVTVDHSPDRPDEHARILASGGFITKASPGEQP